MPPMLVSFTGLRDGRSAWGWVVIDASPIRTAEDMNSMCDQLAKLRGYDPGGFVILSFQRLES